MGRKMEYARRFAAVPQVLDLLRHHPDGLPLPRLAELVGVPEAQLRRELTTFFVADVADRAWGVRSSVIEFAGPDGTAADAARATRVRLVSDDPLSELGVELLDAHQLGLLHRVAWDMARTEPDNEVLRRTVDRLRDTLLPHTADDAAPPGSDLAARLAAAVRRRHRVRFTYARAWDPGVHTRVVEPYRLTSTRRGFELDGAALDREGAVRTFLVAGIRDLEELDEHFTPPPDVEKAIARGRRTTAVRLLVPLDREWVVERFAERIERGRADDEDVELTAHVVPPVRDRVGLMVAVAGPGAAVLSPPDLRDADVDTARRLLAHHGLVNGVMQPLDLPGA
ncbi:MAG: helix-turn-helix transcriptional regulator [Kineosporiaceae bacterium]